MFCSKDDTLAYAAWSGLVENNLKRILAKSILPEAFCRLKHGHCTSKLCRHAKTLSPSAAATDVDPKEVKRDKFSKPTSKQRSLNIFKEGINDLLMARVRCVGINAHSYEIYGRLWARRRIVSVLCV